VAVDVNLVIAALLHDAIEDQAISRSLIAEQFGDDVASLVEEVTGDKSLPKAVRKRLQEHASEKSNRAKILKLADKISNVAIGRDPPPDWSIRRQREYIQQGRDLVAGLRGASAQLEVQRYDTKDEPGCCQ
jgi:guanosine-3',5'-bis(diphosphate) 3'-pyrophosphohydrolase